MSDTSKATARPWAQSMYYEVASTILDADGFGIADVNQIAILEDYAKKLKIRHWAQSKKASRELSDEETEANAALIVEAVNSYDRLRRIEKLAGELANKAEDVGNLLRAYVCTPQAWDNEVVTQKGFDLEQQARELQALIEGKTPTVEPCANPDSIGTTSGKDSGH